MNTNQKSAKLSRKFRVNPVEFLIFAMVFGVFAHSVYTLVADRGPFEAVALLPEAKRPQALTPNPAKNSDRSRSPASSSVGPAKQQTFKASDGP